MALAVAMLASGSALKAGQGQRREQTQSAARTLWQWVVSELKAANPWASKACEAGSSTDPVGCPLAASSAEDPGERGSSTDPDG